MSNWTERPVSRGEPHFVLSHRHDDYASPVALVGPAIDGKFAVELLIRGDSADELEQDVVRDVLKEIDFYLNEVGGPDPWVYARYHCGTAANAYSRVRWGYFEASG